MSTVFPLWHVRKDDEYGDDAKFIGVYSSADAVAGAITRLSNQPGFADYPAGFQFGPYEIDKDHWTEGFVDAQD
ncbi:MAG: hypothetical protein V4537_04630 [Pseudomonadota bacterium]